VAIALILFYAARFDGIEGQRAGRALEAEAGDTGGDRRLRQPSACAHPDGARPGRRAAANGLPAGARGRRASLGEAADNKPMRLLETRTIGECLAYLACEIVR
jgi:hypothetical protein